MRAKVQEVSLQRAGEAREGGLESRGQVAVQVVVLFGEAGSKIVKVRVGVFVVLFGRGRGCGEGE